MKHKFSRFNIATLVSGFAMWITAGLWHNLILPMVNENIEAHHEGLVLMLISYIILAFLMATIYSMIRRSENIVLDGLKIGIIIGVLWVFPHGLAMAGAHNTSVFYEIKNTIWHMVEQGIGGIVIALIMEKNSQG
ncbi:MAG: hypothetical protein HQ510_05140 [Candidatus Marinimicrobia bacterium]|nr:hypothetical protein [Candidatus Neomarinimicrobiota bacterium]